jgi:hypothetical protein
MAFGKWNSSGELGWASTDILKVADLNDSIDEAAPPVGTVMAWAKSFTGVPASLPSGWVQCDGQTLSDADSPLNGQVMPAMNAANRFARGGTTSGTTGGATTHSHSAFTTGNATAGGSGAFILTNSPYNWSTVASIPSYYDVVWIIRVK